MIYFPITCVYSFSVAEFCDCIQTIEYILFLKWRHSVAVIELQGSFLSTCLCTICCVWRFISKNHCLPHGMAAVLFCSCLCGTHCITWQTNYGWMWDNYLTKPAWKHCLMYYVILPHNAIMCIMITFYKEKPANSCLSIDGCTRNCLCCAAMRTDHL